MAKCYHRSSTGQPAKAQDKLVTLIKPHVERFNNILRQRLARFVRKTLSFSKLDTMHDNCLRLFLDEYNQPKYQQPSRRKNKHNKHY